ncbi:MAG: hypothetical protein KKG75_05045 [Nanoarchaeota archaeon]|nr:hypothetical protein [Nanoarchaeota archaeon]
MPEKIYSKGSNGKVDSRTLRRLLLPELIPAGHNSFGETFLRCELYEKEPTLVGDLSFRKLGTYGDVLTEQQKQHLTYLFEQQALYEGISLLEHAIALASDSHTVAGVERLVLNNGGGFIGVALWDCPPELKEKFFETLKTSLVTKIKYPGGNRVVAKKVDLSTKFFDEEDMWRCRIHRGTNPNSVYLFFDPKNLLKGDKFRDSIYGLNLRDFIPYAKKSVTSL